MFRLRLVLPICVALSVLVGCGSSKPRHVVTTIPHVVPSSPPQVITPSLARLCPSGASQMGCAGRQRSLKPTIGRVGAAPAGPLFPDVYEGQGTVDWGAVAAWQKAHGWKAAAVFKLGEYRVDNAASRNASETARRGFWRAGYWFVRNTGCGHEAAQIKAAGRSLGLKIIVLDAEVPEAAGYVGCLTPSLKAAGFVVVVYTSPGTWPGGQNLNLPLWVATFGSRFGCVWTCSPAAWQFTDGTFGSPTHVPGIGFDDVSVDLGITKLGGPPPPPPPPPDPHHYLWFSRTPIPSRWGRIAERATVEHYDGARQHPLKYYYYIARLQAELQVLATRDYDIAHYLHHSNPTWSLYHRGWRYQQLIQRGHGKKLV